MLFAFTSFHAGISSTNIILVVIVIPKSSILNAPSPRLSFSCFPPFYSSDASAFLEFELKYPFSCLKFGVVISYCGFLSDCSNKVGTK